MILLLRDLNAELELEVAALTESGWHALALRNIFIWLWAALAPGRDA